jgi:hypothetical protein
MDKRLKYFKEIHDRNLNDCPPSEILGSNKAFHFAFSPIEDPRNFRTPFERKPVRKNTKDFNCTDFAISFFNSENKAETFFFSILNEHVRVKLGYTHISAGELTEDDGYQTIPEKDGHFDLFEFIDRRITFATRFKIVSLLKAK